MCVAKETTIVQKMLSVEGIDASVNLASKSQEVNALVSNF